MQGNSRTGANVATRVLAPSSLLHPGTESHNSSSSIISNYNNEDDRATDLETYDVGEYHLTTCPICLEHFTLDNPAILLKCEHGFHLQCLESWRQRSSMCPMCFAPVVGDEGRLMSSSDVRRRRRIQRRSLPAERSTPERSPLLSPMTTERLEQSNCNAGRISDRGGEIEVVEVLEREQQQQQKA